MTKWTTIKEEAGVALQRATTHWQRHYRVTDLATGCTLSTEKVRSADGTMPRYIFNDFKRTADHMATHAS